MRRYAAALHLLPPDQLPALVVVDDLSELAAGRHGGGGGGYGGGGYGGGADGFGGGGGRGQRDAEITKALALLSDALDTARGAAAGADGDGGANAPRWLFVSDAGGDEGPRGLYLLARWFDAVLALTGAPPGGLALRVAGGAPQHVPAALARARLHYSVLPSGLGVDAISWAAGG